MMMRDEIQREAVQTWLPSKKGTVVLPTGFGKSRVGEMAFAEVKPKTCLIVTSRAKICDQ